MKMANPITMILWAIVALTIPLSALAQTPETIKCLFLGDQGGHRPPERFEELQPQLKPRGIELTYTEDVGQLNLENLKQYDALVLYANIDQISQSQAQALLDYVDQGGGFVPLHCASFCFRNSDEVVALMGAQFQRHGTGVFRTQQQQETPDGILEGFEGFETWDETYVHHLHNEENRTVLAYRFEKGQADPEPWTWVRTQGKGRVFYTAWGHDARTWTHPGFHNLVERGIRWAAKRNPQDAADYRRDAPFEVPTIKPVPEGLKPFDYVDVGSKIPNYTPSDTWGKQGDNFSLMQKPLPADESIKHLAIPEGFHAELFVSEPQIQGKPIAMNWDERGRLWICETVDYPNELKNSGKGRDRIRICEDTDRDGKADKFTVFAEELSIPTSLTFWKGGVIVQNAEQTLYLKDTNGDDVSDTRTVLMEGWQLGDTHGGVSNFHYGLDNWIWGMQGYNRSAPRPEDGEAKQRFRQGFFRFTPDGEDIEFIRSTNNNTWGLGFSEEGIVFGSTANGCPSVHMPIPNRYYEKVKGWTSNLTLQSIAKSNKFEPITDKVRQVDFHGGFTAGAGHALYTARQYPESFWNRVAFVNGPTGHLVASFVLNARGSVFRSENMFNLVASDDEWTAPIMSEIGPDGQVWVIDWYNYIVQHNPTPAGFKTGKGAAYETDLRDKKYGRIYRIVADGTDGKDYPDLSKASPERLVEALTNPTMLVRLHAQRLLVERGKQDVVDALIKRVQDTSADAIGLNVGAIHAIWTLHGLGALQQDDGGATQAVVGALRHPSAGVRRNAAMALPATTKMAGEILSAGLHRDADFQVRLMALLAIADCDQSNSQIADALVEVIRSPGDMADRWISDALTSAAATHSEAFLSRLQVAQDLRDPAIGAIGVVAEHHGRSAKTDSLLRLVTQLGEADQRLLGAIVSGLERGASSRSDLENAQLESGQEQQLMELFENLPAPAQASFIRLATKLELKEFDQFTAQVVDGYLGRIQDASTSVRQRIAAARELIAFQPESDEIVEEVVNLITPQLDPETAEGLVNALEESRSNSVGEILIERLKTMTPKMKSATFSVLLKRNSGTKTLLEAAENNLVSLTDLAIDQRQFLLAHGDQEIAAKAKELLAKGGSLPSADRQQVIEKYLPFISQPGDVAMGKEVFKQQCAKCHVYGEEGADIGPNLTGMAVHPREELLTHILDPNRDVEANFRTYSVMTLDGLMVSGMLASESKTTVELVDTEGKRQSLLRDDIDQFVMSRKSVMPEGFEASITPKQMTDLLAFITQKQRFVPLNLEKVATVISTDSMFYGGPSREDHIVFEDWKVKQVDGVPFQLIDPQNGVRKNAIILRGHRGELSERMPDSVKIPCAMKAKTIHVLGGVGGWSHPFDQNQTVSMIVKLTYADGESETHEWINGQHIADYFGYPDVPKSKKAFELDGRQVRYLTVTPKRDEKLESIELLRGKDLTAPIVFSMTVEGDGAEAKH